MKTTRVPNKIIPKDKGQCQQAKPNTIETEIKRKIKWVTGVLQ